MAKATTQTFLLTRDLSLGLFNSTITQTLAMTNKT